MIEVSLSDIAADRTHKFLVFYSFHTFSDSRNAKFMRKLDNLFQDEAVSFTVQTAVTEQKTPVELELDQVEPITLSEQ